MEDNGSFLIGGGGGVGEGSKIQTLAVTFQTVGAQALPPQASAC